MILYSLYCGSLFIKPARPAQTCVGGRAGDAAPGSAAGTSAPLSCALQIVCSASIQPVCAETLLLPSWPCRGDSCGAFACRPLGGRRLEGSLAPTASGTRSGKDRSDRCDAARGLQTPVRASRTLAWGTADGLCSYRS